MSARFARQADSSTADQAGPATQSKWRTNHATLSTASICRGCGFRPPDGFPARHPPPHLVVFLSDDHGAIGDAPRSALDMRTSNMTRVAKAGLLFKQAFVNSPACARSRAALLTGQNPSGNGAEANHTKPSAEVRKLPSLLQGLGYEVVAFDKVSRYCHTEDSGFEFFPHDGLHNTGHARCWHKRLAKMLALNLT